MNVQTDSDSLNKINNPGSSSDGPYMEQVSQTFICLNLKPLTNYCAIEP